MRRCFLEVLGIKSQEYCIDIVDIWLGMLRRVLKYLKKYGEEKRREREEKRENVNIRKNICQI